MSKRFKNSVLLLLFAVLCFSSACSKPPPERPVYNISLSSKTIQFDKAGLYEEMCRLLKPEDNTLYDFDNGIYFELAVNPDQTIRSFKFSVIGYFNNAVINYYGKYQPDDGTVNLQPHFQDGMQFKSDEERNDYRQRQAHAFKDTLTAIDKILFEHILANLDGYQYDFISLTKSVPIQTDGEGNIYANVSEEGAFKSFLIHNDGTITPCFAQQKLTGILSAFSVAPMLNNGGSGRIIYYIEGA